VHTLLAEQDLTLHDALLVGWSHWLEEETSSGQPALRAFRPDSAGLRVLILPDAGRLLDIPMPGVLDA
jgi:hypothetical protein